jgi:hypothetical protein
MSRELSQERMPDEEFEERLAKRRRERLGAISPEARAYMALAPIWTQELAELCGLVEASKWEGFQQQAQSMGLMEIEDTFTGEGKRSVQFWMPDAMRPTVLGDLRDEPGRQFLHQMASEAGQSIADQADAGIYVPVATKRWAELARLVDSKGADTTAAARELTTQIEDRLKEARTDLAVDWLRSGEDLAGVLRGQMEANVSLGTRRIELAYRRALDERYLARFVPRTRQIEAFEELVAGEGGYWALHYLGMGGVGKTMLLRYITYFEPDQENGVRVPTCRIDFDILDPGFPVRRPGELLLALAQDLRRLFTQSEQDSTYVSLENAVKHFHKVLGPPPPDRPLAHLEDPRFEDIVAMFADLLKLMPKPVVLILDTCEELVKSEFGDELPHVDATFKIMKRVHDKMPEMRVIFAGRRLLTQGGDGWSMPADERPGAKSYLLEPQERLRLYLMRGFDEGEANELFDRYPRNGVRMPDDLREVIREVSPELGTPARVLAADGRPLTLTPDLFQRTCQALESSAAFQQRAELDRLFEDERLRVWRDQLPESEALADMVRSTLYFLLDERTDDGENALALLLRCLAASPSTSEAGRSDLERLAAELTLHLKRYNPYTLNVYSQWYQDDDKLTAETIRSGEFDPYIEMRIIERITEKDVRSLLPAVVELRYFDQEMLRPAYSGGDRAFEAAFAALSSQEWMRYARDRKSGETMLHVDRNLHPMLRDYYVATDEKALATARRQLGPPLAQKVADSTLGELGLIRLNTALSLLPDGEAARLWSQVELKIGGKGDWASAQRIVRFVGSSEVGAAGRGASLLRAAVLATQTAARLQRDLAYDPTEDWKSVANILDEIDPALAASPMGRWLEQRAALGRIAASRVSDEATSDEQKHTLTEIMLGRIRGTEGFHRAQVQQQVGSLLAAYEAVLDRAEERGEQVHLPEYFSWAVGEMGAGTPHPKAFMESLSARSVIQWANWEGGIDRFERAQFEASQTEDEWWRQPKPWADWHAPASQRDRIRLEMLRLLPGEPPLDKLTPWLNEAARLPERLRQIDSERLQSAILLRSLARGPIPRERLTRYQKQVEYVRERQPVCAAHREIPPLFVTLARGWLAVGAVAQAEAILSTHKNASLKAADDAADDVATVTAATKEQLSIARRMRQGDVVRKLRAELDQAGLEEKGLPDSESWPAAVLSGALHPFEDLPTPGQDSNKEDLHAWWRCQYGPSVKSWSWPRRLDEIPEDRWAGFPPWTEVVALLALALDDEERRLLAGKQLGWPAALPARIGAYFGHPIREYSERLRPAFAEEVVRLFLRGFALNSYYLARPQSVERLVENRVVDLGGGRESTSPEELLRGLNLAPVGKRRAAVIALEEGELLALRLPLQAARLLVQARQWFVEVDDDLGATQASILATSALVRSGQEGAASAALAITRDCYERLAEGGDLPTWQDLVSMAPDTPVKAADKLIQHPWGEWFVRLLACMDWGAGGAVAGENGESVRLWRWTKEHYGRALVPELYVAPLEEAHLVAEPELKPEVEEESNLSWILFGLLGVAVLLGILIGPYFALRWLVNAVTGGISTGWMIGLYVLLWVLIAIIPGRQRALFKRLRARLAQRMEVRLDITSWASAEPRGFRWRGIPVRYHLHQGRRWDPKLWPPPLSLRSEPRETEQRGRVTLGQTYAEATQGIGGEFSTELGQLQTLMYRRPLAVPLYVGEGLAAYPWEAMLALSLPEEAPNTGREVLQFYRTIDRGRVPQESWSGEVRIIASEIWAGLFEASWQPLQAEARIVGRFAELWDLEAIKVLHLVGRPVQTSAGLRLHVDSGVYEKRSAVQDTSDYHGGALVDAWDLPLKHTWLVIVQAEPVEGLSRDETKRRNAASLRTLANGMFQADVQAVIAVPPLPPDLARDAVARLAEELKGRASLNRMRMLGAAARMRDVIRSATGPEKDLMETALEVCVFWRPTTEAEERLRSRRESKG